MKTKKIVLSAMFIAIGVLGSSIYIPMGVAKCFPVQHAINVVSAIALGPVNGVAIAFCISLLRNILGTGTLLAFSGSMVGAALAGSFYKKTKKNFMAVMGEIIGTGILGSLMSFPIAKLIMGKSVGAFAFIIPFGVSTVVGSVIAYLLVMVFEKTKVMKTI